MGMAVKFSPEQHQSGFFRNPQTAGITDRGCRRYGAYLSETENLAVFSEYQKNKRAGKVTICDLIYLKVISHKQFGKFSHLRTAGKNNER